MFNYTETKIEIKLSITICHWNKLKQAPLVTNI